ncbi:MAG TPA: hypothetical protein ENK57_15175 [Polyangiaceae bacterium]|nr:hypothetical protein [Polyangiaceae bacterium]
MKLPEPGLYRTTKAYPGHEETIPAGVLVYVGVPQNGGLPFVVRPGANRNNRWFWGEPTIPFRAVSWGDSLVKLPSEGFYTLPEEIAFEGGGKWLENAIVQLGYNGEGKGIIFVGEQHEEEERNILVFSDKGRMIDDKLLNRLRWAPILPVPKNATDS